MASASAYIPLMSLLSEMRWRLEQVGFPSSRLAAILKQAAKAEKAKDDGGPSNAEDQDSSE